MAHRNFDKSSYELKDSFDAKYAAVPNLLLFTVAVNQDRD